MIWQATYTICSRVSSFASTITAPQHKNFRYSMPKSPKKVVSDKNQGWMHQLQKKQLDVDWLCEKKEMHINSHPIISSANGDTRMS
jgi:hypothetical protein